MRNFCQKLQQMQIVISYWTNQTIFVFTGQTEEEQLGVGFEQNRATISKMQDEQAELLNIFIFADGNVYGKLKIISDRISQMLTAVIDVASEEDKRAYNDLLQVVRKNCEHLHTAVMAL